MPINKQNMILGGVLVAMTGAFVLGVWMPESRNLADYRKRIDAAQEKLSPTFNQTANIADRQDVVSSLTQQIDASDRYVPASQDLAQLLRSLTESVKDSGIAEHQIETGEVELFKHYSMIPLRMELQGSFAATYGVVSQIESMQRLVRLDAINLRAQDDNRNQGNGKLQASVRLSTFFSGEEGGGL